MLLLVVGGQHTAHKTAATSAAASTHSAGSCTRASELLDDAVGASDDGDEAVLEDKDGSSDEAEEEE